MVGTMTGQYWFLSITFLVLAIVSIVIGANPKAYFRLRHSLSGLDYSVLVKNWEKYKSRSLSQGSLLFAVCLAASIYYGYMAVTADERAMEAETFKREFHEDLQKTIRENQEELMRRMPNLGGGGR
jgi:hypothetical protein